MLTNALIMRGKIQITIGAQSEGGVRSSTDLVSETVLIRGGSRNSDKRGGGWIFFQRHGVWGRLKEVHVHATHIKKFNSN